MLKKAARRWYVTALKGPYLSWTFLQARNLTPDFRSYPTDIGHPTYLTGVSKENRLR